MEKRIKHSKKIKNNYEIFTENGRERTQLELNEWINRCVDLDIGEIFLSSIDKEGLCKGLDENLIMNLKENNLPISYGGGVGNLDHCLKFLHKHRVDGLFIASAIHYHYYKDKFKNTYEKLNKDNFIELKPTFCLKPHFLKIDLINQNKLLKFLMISLSKNLKKII